MTVAQEASLINQGLHCRQSELRTCIDSALESVSIVHVYHANHQVLLSSADALQVSQSLQMLYHIIYPFLD